ncbi:MAG: hypothetical protein H0X26_05040 [Alphaproteobacteria bacterium]|nr:hypothetical protein [Alphaproteobacteria bacterium]
MENSIFLAKALGIYLIFISMTFVLCEKRLKDLILDMTKNSALMLVAGFMGLIVGILLVVSHNHWVKDWRVIITVVGWMALLKGMSLILFPDLIVKMSKQWINNKFAYYTTFLLSFLIGVILIYFGYLKD